MSQGGLPPLHFLIFTLIFTHLGSITKFLIEVGLLQMVREYTLGKGMMGFPNFSSRKMKTSIFQVNVNFQKGVQGKSSATHLPTSDLNHYSWELSFEVLNHQGELKKNLETYSYETSLTYGYLISPM